MNGRKRAALALAPGFLLLAAAVVTVAAPVARRAAAAPSRAWFARTRMQRATHRLGMGGGVTLRRDPFEPPQGAVRDTPEVAQGRPFSPGPPATGSGPPTALPVVRAVIAGRRRLALVELGGQARIVATGARLGPWRVEQVGDDGVRFVRIPMEVRH